MIKAHRVDDHESTEIVFVGVVVAMPAHHIEWRVTLQGERLYTDEVMQCISSQTEWWMSLWVWLSVKAVTQDIT